MLNYLAIHAKTDLKCGLARPSSGVWVGLWEGALDGLAFFQPTSRLKNSRFCPFLGRCQKEHTVKDGYAV